jgi:hypothetical protein
LPVIVGALLADEPEVEDAALAESDPPPPPQALSVSMELAQKTKDNKRPRD